MSKGLSIVGSSRKNGEREVNDFYPTPHFVTEELLKREKFDGNIWEPACGRGDISKVLIDNGYSVYSSDLIDRGYGDGNIDFINNTSFKKFDNIITNPPYKYALEFVNSAKKHSNKKIALFLKTVFLESEKRYDMFQDTEFPLARIYQFSKRVALNKNIIDTSKSGMIAYAWYIWDIEHVGKPTIDWIKI